MAAQVVEEDHVVRRRVGFPGGAQGLFEKVEAEVRAVPEGEAADAAGRKDLADARGDRGGVLEEPAALGLVRGIDGLFRAAGAQPADRAVAPVVVDVVGVEVDVAGSGAGVAAGFADGAGAGVHRAGVAGLFAAAA